jgi:hypothetical protein
MPIQDPAIIVRRVPEVIRRSIQFIIVESFLFSGTALAAGKPSRIFFYRDKRFAFLSFLRVLCLI